MSPRFNTVRKRVKLSSGVLEAPWETLARADKEFLLNEALGGNEDAKSVLRGRFGITLWIRDGVRII